MNTNFRRQILQILAQATGEAWSSVVWQFFNPNLSTECRENIKLDRVNLRNAVEEYSKTLNYFPDVIKNNNHGDKNK